MHNPFCAELRAWYEANKRDLRWRHTRDPYCIWLSETILQQTRVQQGAAYYDRFLERCPGVRELATLPDDEVMKLWQGLGYYSRARNLLAAARQIVRDHAGEFPQEYAAIRALPGIGEYTAAAVCSIAYDQPYAVVDGNVYRLYARLFDIDTPIDTTAGQRAFRSLADELLDRSHPGEYNQAVMEFGALLCTPASPRCEECPLADHCLARAAGTVDQRPVKQGRTRIRDRYLNYLHLSAHGNTLIHRREGRDIWQGLYEFPLIETSAPCEFEQLDLSSLLSPEVSFCLLRTFPMPPHQLSHQRLHARFFHLELEQLPILEGCISVPESSLGDYAVPRLIDRYLGSL